jgi:hypothetical protein
MVAWTVIAFGLAWWLGLYLIARDPRKPVLRRAGAGLFAYAGALGCAALRAAGESEPVAAVQGVLVCLPALAWTGVVVRLLPPESPWPQRLDRAWLFGLVPLVTVALAAVVVAGDAPALAGEGTAAGPAHAALAVLVLVPLALAVGLAAAHWRRFRPALGGGVLAVATLQFALGAVALLFPLGWLPDGLLMAGIGADLLLLGLAVALFDAFAEGESLRADMRRSLLTAAAMAALFGSQVGLAIAVGGELTRVLAALLLGTVAAAITVQVLGKPLAGALDRAAFPGDAQLQQARADLRDVADALPKRAQPSPLDELDDDEFARVTRRALAHYGDLGKLVNSPLTALPAVGARLAARGAPDQPLERATELKGLLFESIQRLKPRDGDFGTSDEWRFYNALHFSYVVGIRPYGRRARHDGLDGDARRALDWFARQVPERTLYNWQNAAARVVAADLRARASQESPETGSSWQ